MNEKENSETIRALHNISPLITLSGIFIMISSVLVSPYFSNDNDNKIIPFLFLLSGIWGLSLSFIYIFTRKIVEEVNEPKITKKWSERSKKIVGWLQTYLQYLHYALLFFFLLMITGAISYLLLSSSFKEWRLQLFCIFIVTLALSVILTLVIQRQRISRWIKSKKK